MKVYSKDELLEFVSKGELDKAIILLKRALPENEAVVQLSSNYETLKGDRILDILTEEHYRKSYNSISLGVILFIKENYEPVTKILQYEIITTAYDKKLRDNVEGLEYGIFETDKAFWLKDDFIKSKREKLIESENSTLFTWYDANKYAPNGWKLPTSNDYKTLINQYGSFIDKVIPTHDTYVKGILSMSQYILKGAIMGKLESGFEGMTDENAFNMDWDEIYWTGTEYDGTDSVSVFLNGPSGPRHFVPNSILINRKRKSLKARVRYIKYK